MHPDVQRKSLIAFYFGSTVATTGPKNESSVRIIAQRAYRDLNRTLTGFGSHPDRVSIHSEVLSSIFQFVQGLGNVHSQAEFDTKHHEWCEEICQIYKSKPHPDRPFQFHYGQAQKWINMTIKYLTVLDHPGAQHVYKFSHVPIDLYVIRGAKAFGINPPPSKVAWSRLSYEQYFDYQNELRQMIKNKTEYSCPLDWEAQIWAGRNGYDPLKTEIKG